MDEAQKATCRADHEALFDCIEARLARGDIGLAVLDEVLDAVGTGMLSPQRLESLPDRFPQVELVFTGRAPSEALVQRADYLSRIEAVRHPYHNGVAARRGIEY